MIPGIVASGIATGGGGGSSHRYWRLYVTAPVSGSVLAIAEAAWRATSGGMALAVSATAASTVLTTFTHTLAADGITNVTNNCWVPSVSAFPAWISFDLGTPQTVAEVAIWPQYDAIGDARAPKDFDVQFSDDNASWTTCDSYTGQTTGWNGGAGTARAFAVTP